MLEEFQFQFQHPVAVCSIIKELAWRLRGFIGLTIAIGFPLPLLLSWLSWLGIFEDFPGGGSARGKAFQVAESFHRKTDANVTANDCGAASYQLPGPSPSQISL